LQVTLTVPVNPVTLTPVNVVVVSVVGAQIFTMVRVVARSSLVIVHVLVSPLAIVPEQFTAELIA